MEFVETLPDDHKKQLIQFMENFQLEHALRQANSMTQQCFSSCVKNFRTKVLDEKETQCVKNCADKMLRSQARSMLRFAEYQEAVKQRQEAARMVQRQQQQQSQK